MQTGRRQTLREIVGDCYDNPLRKSYFASLEYELIDRRRFATKTEARLAHFQYIGASTTPEEGTRPSDTSHPETLKEGSSKQPESQIVNRP